MPLSSYPPKKPIGDDKPQWAPFMCYVIYLKHPQYKRWWSCGTELLEEHDPVECYMEQCRQRDLPVPDAVICWRVSNYD